MQISPLPQVAGEAAASATAAAGPPAGMFTRLLAGASSVPMLAQGEAVPAANAVTTVALPAAVTIPASLLAGDDPLPDDASLLPQGAEAETIDAAATVKSAVANMPAVAAGDAANDTTLVQLPMPEIEATDAGLDADRDVELDLPPATEDGAPAPDVDVEPAEQETVPANVVPPVSADGEAAIKAPVGQMGDLAVDRTDAGSVPTVPSGEPAAEPESDTSARPEAHDTARVDNRASSGGTTVRDTPTPPAQDGGFADALAAAPSADAPELSVAGSDQGSAQDLSEAQRPEPRISTAAGRLPQDMSVEIAKRIRNGDVELTVRLDPAELGRVEVKLGFDDGGVLRSVIAAESPAALELLRRDAADLARALQAAGVSTDAGSFRFDRQSRGEGQAPQQTDLGGHSDAARSLADDAAPQPIRLAAGRVDILA